MTTAMSSWRVLTSVRLVRLASVPACQTTAPGTILQTRSGSSKASYADNEKQQNKNDKNSNNGQKAAIAVASATALALKVYYDQEGIALKAQTDEDDFAHENRVRMYMAPDKIFNYFAAFQLISGSGQGILNMMIYSPCQTTICSMTIVSVSNTTPSLQMNIIYYWGLDMGV